MQELFGLVGFGDPLCPFLVGRLLLTALVAHDALALATGLAAIPSRRRIVATVPAPATIFAGHDLVPPISHATTRPPPEGSCGLTKNPPRARQERRYGQRQDFFFGTLAPLLRASDRPIAIACLRLVTFLPERPLFSVPALRFFMARLTFLAAPFEYFRFFAFLAISSS
jgi:hypothetical protein